MNLKTVKDLRISKNMTQQELATLIGKDRTLISKIENGDTKPSVKTAKSLAKILDVEWTIFFDKKGE